MQSFPDSRVHSDQPPSVQAWDLVDLNGNPAFAPQVDAREFAPLWQAEELATAESQFAELISDLDNLGDGETQPASMGSGWDLPDFSALDIYGDSELGLGARQDYTVLMKELFKERQQIAQERKAAQQALNEAKQTLQQAQAEAQSILSQARLQAAAKVDEANVQNNILQQSFNQKLAQIQEQVSEQLNTARSIAEEARAWRDNLYRQGETVILQLVIRIGQALFSDGFVLDPSTLGRAFARALVEARMLGNLRVYVNPADAAQLSPYWLEQQATVSGQKIELVPSDSIKRGGCYIDGQFGAVDALVESQFQSVREALMAHLPPEGREIE